MSDDPASLRIHHPIHRSSRRRDVQHLLLLRLSHTVRLQGPRHSPPGVLPSAVHVRSEETKDPTDGAPRHCMYLLTERGERVEGYTSPRFHYAVIATKRRQRIATVFIAHPSSSTTLLFSHGNATDLGCMRPHLVDLSEQLCVNIMAYDYSGYGLSSGLPTAANCNADIAAVYRHLRTVHPTACHRIILYGQSLGSGPTLYLASRDCVSGIIIHSGLLSCVRVLDPTVTSTPFYDLFPNVSLSTPPLNTRILTQHIQHAYHIEC